ncbi:hypothetical protein Tco_0442699 [Tanacetum coccineum]
MLKRSGMLSDMEEVYGISSDILFHVRFQSLTGSDTWQNARICAKRVRNSAGVANRSPAAGWTYDNRSIDDLVLIRRRRQYLPSAYQTNSEGKFK